MCVCVCVSVRLYVLCVYVCVRDRRRTHVRSCVSVLVFLLIIPMTVLIIGIRVPTVPMTVPIIGIRVLILLTKGTDGQRGLAQRGAHCEDVGALIPIISTSIPIIGTVIGTVGTLIPIIGTPRGCGGAHCEDVGRLDEPEGRIRAAAHACRRSAAVCLSRIAPRPSQAARVQMRSMQRTP